MTEKPHFLARKIQDFQRASAKGFVCPFCTTVENFQQEARLWEHAKNSHPNELGISEKGDEVEVRKQLRLNATERAYVIRLSTPHAMVGNISCKPQPRVRITPHSAILTTMLFDVGIRPFAG